MAKLNVTERVAQVEVNGAVYTKVDRSVAEGDVVKALQDGLDITDGGFYAVYADNDGELTFDDDEGDARSEWLQECTEYFEVYEKVVEEVPEPALRLTVGDYAKVVRDDEVSGHNYEIGSVVKIVQDEHDYQPYVGEKADGYNGNYLDEEDVEPATEAEFLAQKQPEPPAEDDVITRDGRRYRKVARKANVGDLVIVVKNNNDHVLSIGSVVTITRGPSLYGSMGTQVPGSWMSDGDYAVLEPIEDEVKTEPPAESPYVIHDGAVYVKQARKAEVGELIVVTAWESRRHISDHSSVGDIKTAAYVDNDGDVHPGGIPVIYLSEYNVLVPVGTEKRKAAVGERIIIVKAQMTGGTYADGDVFTVLETREGCVKTDVGGRSIVNTVGHDEYVVLADQIATTEVKRKATVGDRIRIVATADRRWQNGEEFVVDEESGSGVLVKHPRGTISGRAYVSCGEYVVIPSVTEVKRKAAVGERIRIVKEYASCGLYKNGDELTVKRVVGSGGVGCDTPAGEAYVSYIHGEYVVLDRAASATPPVSPRLNVGDYAKVIDGRGSSKCSVGDIVKITERGGRDGETLTFETGGGVIGWMYARRFVLATEGERKQVEEDVVTAKWSKIGRKVNEFKAGDVVENGGKLYTVTGVGEPGYICAEDGVTLTGDQWRFKYNVNLIAPVESLFNGR